MALLFGTEVNLCYVIASLQRTGSYLLCETLESTGIAGGPTEPFSPDNKDMFCQKWGLPNDIPFIDFVAEVVKHCTTPNGVFGIKIHWSQIEWSRKQLGIGTERDEKTLDYLFPADTRYIHLTRRDIRGQAISSYRAYHTNEWWRKDDVYNPQVWNPDPPYNSEKIRYWERMFINRQADWIRYFKERNKTALHVEYADLDNDWRKEVARCLTFLDLDPKAVDTAPEPQLVRQADAISRAWRKRLDEEDAATQREQEK
jgi:LPS sulfotransferase NodH